MAAAMLGWQHNPEAGNRAALSPTHPTECACKAVASNARSNDTETRIMEQRIAPSATKKKQPPPPPPPQQRQQQQQQQQQAGRTMGSVCSTMVTRVFPPA
jgi:hypothetical protein